MQTLRGYHHASRSAAEGFAFTTTFGLPYGRLKGMRYLSASDRVLTVDVDAHQGNGSAYVFTENRNEVLLDMYNDDLYRRLEYTKSRTELLDRARRTGGIFHRQP